VGGAISGSIEGQPFRASPRGVRVAVRVALVAGASDRRKLIELAGEPAALLARLRAWQESGRG
jgi:hypothetical protein